MTQTSVLLDSDMLERLETVAAILSISKEEALREAIESYIDEVAFRADVTAGREDVQRVDIYPSEEVEAYFANKRRQLMAEREI